MVMVQWMPDHPNGILVQFPERWEAVDLVDVDTMVRLRAADSEKPNIIFCDLSKSLIPPPGVMPAAYSILRAGDFSHIKELVLISESKMWCKIYRKLAYMHPNLFSFKVRCMYKDGDPRRYS